MSLPSRHGRVHEVNLDGRVWQFRRPAPHTAVYLAQYASGKSGEDSAAALDFLRACLLPASWEALCDDAFDHRTETDVSTITALMEAVATEGAARPLRAILGLCSVTARQWPTIRGRLTTSGGANPLARLAHLHELLDAVESMIVEGKKDDKARADYWRSFYGPTLTEEVRERPGWTAEEEMSAFDAWLEES